MGEIGEKEKTGIVILLDALGVQNNSIEDSRAFIQHIHSLTRSYIPEYMKAYGDAEKKRNSTEFEALELPMVRAFGDTILITWEVKDINSLLYQMDIVGGLIGVIIINSISEHVLYRGAIAIGKYIESESTILGPAIADAAMWYESTDWFGCICTPKATKHLNYLECNNERKPYCFFKYAPPIKGEGEELLWCVDWPYEISLQRNRKNPICWYYEHISNFEIPKGVESKYRNSESFLKTSYDAHKGKVPKTKTNS